MSEFSPSPERPDASFEAGRTPLRWRRVLLAGVAILAGILGAIFLWLSLTLPVSRALEPRAARSHGEAPTRSRP
jgi:hypothetical protein